MSREGVYEDVTPELNSEQWEGAKGRAASRESHAQQVQRSCGGNNLALGFVLATERPVWLAAQRVFSKCVEYFDLHLQIPVADGSRAHSLAEQVFPGGQFRTRQCNKYCIAKDWKTGGTPRGSNAERQ